MAKCIVTADDAPSMRQMVSFTNRQAGYKSLEAYDGKNALELLE